ncbi:MAG: 3-deoxy-D-manno-octulosonic acid transferase [Rhodobacter sp.]|nr:3-deoxy-D-manno-octulosonic acid transferase [Rhodobacter sp.]
MRALARARPPGASSKCWIGRSSGSWACRKPSGIMPEPTGPLLRVWLLAMRALPLVAPLILRRRLAKGKEMPHRWREKLGEATLPRPAGRLVWLHAVGLGEVLALRGLIAAMADCDPEVEFLVTSTTRASAEVLAANLPPRTRHQFLPLDAPRYLARFLDHWRPSLSIWAEQDLWPGAVVATAAQGVPLALVNARMNADAFARRARWRQLYADLFARFDLVGAQDAPTARHLAALGAVGVRVTGSLKSAAPPLSVDATRLTQVQRALKGRRPWVAASSHAEDEAVAFAAQVRLHAADPDWCLILVPRYPGRRGEILAAIPPGLPVSVDPDLPTGAVHLADGFGQLGLWYRLAPVALMGGTFGLIEGHNPWEPAALGAAVLHGPRVANFAQDYESLDGAGAARAVSVETLAKELQALNPAMGAKGRTMAESARAGLAPLAAELLALGGSA